jgi:2-oxoglutarate ferredoxin oxidoreductase subunit gamma
MIQIICSGHGGQGILLMGMILADTSMDLGKYVTWFPSYGAEMRGGTANCHVKISDEEIASPYIRDIDVLIAMNEASIVKFQDKMIQGGLIVYNSSIVPADFSFANGIRKVRVRATDIAIDSGNPKGANMVMLGAFSKYNNSFETGQIKNGIERFFEKKSRKIPQNIRCFEIGEKEAIIEY